MKSRNKTVGYGFVGEWRDGTLGWMMPNHLSRSKRGHGADKATGRTYGIGEPSYLCRITVERILDSRGRSIVRRVKP